MALVVGGQAAEARKSQECALTSGSPSIRAMACRLDDGLPAPLGRCSTSTLRRDRGRRWSHLVIQAGTGSPMFPSYLLDLSRARLRSG